MSNDKAVAVIDPASGMDRTRALDLAERSAQGQPPCHGSGAALLQAAGLAAGRSGPPKRWRGGRRTLARGALAAALAALLPLYSASAQETQVDRRDPDPPAQEGRADTDPTQLDTIQVTGTRIKGGTTSSPVLTIGSERIREEGFSDLGEVIRSVPQNFSGGQNPGVVVGATAGAGGLANQNMTGGSSLNLRGLGPDATLTLLNGRRLSYGGYVQAVDISAIPVEAVERIEIVPDGASAIYGSDAVGGVGNVILKRDYDGARVGWRYGGATDGGLTTREYTATAGTTWSGGGLLATFQNTSTDPIYARQRDYTRQMFDPSTLYPGSDLRSGLISLHQSLGEDVELHLDALQTNRRQTTYPWNTGQTPYFFELIGKTESVLVAPSVEIALPGAWTLTVGGTWGRDQTESRQSRVYIDSGVHQPSYFECYCNRAVSWELGAEGPVASLPAGDARLALGAGGRKNEFTDHNLLTDADVTQGKEGSRFAYAELNLPLIGPEMQLPGVRRLDLSAAVRAEDHDSFGRVTTPKLGLIYGPTEDVTLKTSWGKSFKAPTLLQRYQARSSYVITESYYGGDSGVPTATVVGISGGSRDLQPERATTRTLSLAVHPEALHGLEAELTWFDIDYTNRVVEPITDYARALGNPDYAQFIDYAPTAQSLQGAIDSASVFYNYVGVYDPNDVVAIIYQQYVNVARQRIKGLDLSGSDRFDLGAGRLTLRGAATWLDSTQQNSATQSPYDVAGMLFNPARLHARAGAVWTQGGVSASGFANYTSGVTDRVGGRKTASFTTVDATLRYAVDRPAGAWSGVEVALTAQNLLNRTPPSYVALSPDRPPYDSTNYSAIGRFVSLSVSKQW
jgi:outer membrane receptor protein involved in Fe transport